MKRFLLVFVSVSAATTLLSSCFYGSDPVTAKPELGMRWSNGDQVEVEQTIELRPELLKQAPESGTALAGFETRSFEPGATDLGGGLSLELEFRDGQTLANGEGYIASARVTGGVTDLELYDGSGAVDNIEVQRAGDYLVWAELSDSDSAATWDWVVKSLPIAGGDAVELGRMDDFASLKSAEASFQDFNMTVLDETVWWSPSSPAPEDTVQHVVLAAPVDGSAPAKQIAERVRLVQGSGGEAFVQEQEPLVVNAPSGLRHGGVQDLRALSGEPVFVVENDAQLLANAGKFLAFKAKESYFVADVANQKFVGVEVAGDNPVQVSACGSSFVFESVDIEHNQTAFVIDTNDYSVAGEVSSTGVRCSPNNQ